MAGTDRPSRACSFGDISTTSFFPAKPVGCYGDGGAVFTDNDEWAALIESYRVHGKGTFKYDNVRIGLNSRLDTVQAAILQVKLKAFADYELDAVNAAAQQYTTQLQDIVRTPVIPEGYRSSWAQYTIRLRDKEQRDALQASLKSQGIPSMVYYPKPMHLQTAFAQTPDQVGGNGKGVIPGLTDHNVIPGLTGNLCPVATSLCNRVLSLPMHPYLTEEDIRTVCTAIHKALR
jgi:dTDP-4-amino-4,6-dideoxygalactose transaminase